MEESVDTDNEIWLDVPNYEGLYQASSHGNVRRMKRQSSSRKNLKQRTRKDGYLQVDFCKDGKVKTQSVHRIVASAFLKQVEGKNYINHKDGNKENNLIENLEYCTPSENNLHRFYVLKKGVKPVVCVETGEEFSSIREASRIKGIDNSAISRCCRGIKGYKTAGGFHWKYKEE